MKKLIFVIMALILSTCGLSPAPAGASVTLSDTFVGFSSGETLTVTVYDGTTSATVSGVTVTEHAWGDGKSNYMLSWSGNPGDQYEIYALSSNGQTGFDALSVQQTETANITGPLATAAAVSAIPTNPLLTNDARLADLGLINTVTGKIRFDSTNAIFANSPASAAPSASQIDAELSGVHGSGAWGGNASIVLPPVNGTVYTATATQYVPVRVYEGDTPTITFNLSSNYNGWTPEFAAKSLPSDTTYAMSLRDASWIDASTGQGTIALSSTDTATPGVYRGELKLINGTQTLTAVEFSIQVLPSVIQ